MSLDNVNAFMSQNQTCVLATVDKNGLPQAATVGFSHDSNFTVLIGTNNKSRKYQNLVARAHIAIVVGVEGKETLQYEGTAHEISPTDERLEEHFAKVPMARRFAAEDGQRWFLIQPTWLRYTDFAAQEPVFETRQFS